MVSVTDGQRLGQAAVVRDQDERAAVGGEGLLELFDGFDVEVVGRLIKDEEVHAAGLQQGQPGPGPLARRQRAGRAQRGGAAEPEFGQQRARLLRAQPGG